MSKKSNDKKREARKITMINSNIKISDEVKMIIKEEAVNVTEQFVEVKQVVEPIVNVVKEPIKEDINFKEYKSLNTEQQNQFNDAYKQHNYKKAVHTENRSFEQTNIFVSRSRDKMDLVIELDKTKYKIFGKDVDLFMNDIIDRLRLNIMYLEDGNVVSKESEYGFTLSRSGTVLILRYKEDLFTVPLGAVERVLIGDIRGKSLTRMI